MLAPQSIAILGASKTPGSLAARPLEILLQHSYPGRLYPVNPRHDEILGLKTYARIDEIPEKVDLAVISVKATSVPNLLRECADAGVRSVLVMSSGFAEEGLQGRSIESEIAEIVAQSGMRVAGPNGEGILNVRLPAPVTFSPTVAFDRGLRELIPGNIAVVSQSGGLGFGILSAGLSAGIGFSYIVSTGNEVDLGSLDFAEWLLDDPDTDVIILIVEGIRNAQLLAKVADRARALGKHLIVTKLGRSTAGARAALSHTAHLAGKDAVYRAAFKRHGVINADDQDELLDRAFVLSRSAAMKGRRVGIVTTSGGAGVWLADACEAAGLLVPELSESLQNQMREFMPSYGSALNPVDVTAQAVRAGGSGVTPILTPMLKSDEIDAVVIVSSFASPILEAEQEPLAKMLASASLPVVVYSYTMPGESSVQMLTELGLAWFPTPGRVAGALAALAEANRNASRAIHAGTKQEPNEDPSLQGVLTGTGPWSEYRVKEFLRDWGLPTPQGGLAHSEDEAEAIAQSLGFPVVVKGQAGELVHKSSIGAVCLDIRDASAARDAYRQVTQAVNDAMPNLSTDGVLIEAMHPRRYEMIVGAFVDPDFGPQIVVGAGGVDVETLNDVVVCATPVTADDAREAIESLRGGHQFRSREGIRPYDREAIVQLIVRVSEFVTTNSETIEELDLNPVSVGYEGEGVCVLDAWMR